MHKLKVIGFFTFGKNSTFVESRFLSTHNGIGGGDNETVFLFLLLFLEMAQIPLFPSFLRSADREVRNGDNKRKAPNPKGLQCRW